MKDFLLASEGVQARDLVANGLIFAAGEGQPETPTEVRIVKGAALSAEDRRRLDSLIVAAREGKIARVKLPAVAFTSDDVNNGNFFEFDPKEFDAFAASFTNKPFQRDHSLLMSDRGGTIVRSWAEPPDANGRRWAKADIELTEPWAIAGALGGTIDRFSFGGRVEEKLCSICAKQFADSFFESGCNDHALGKTYEGKTARMLCKGVRGNEISAVVEPAFENTGIGALEIGASGRPHPLDIAAMVRDGRKEIRAMDMKKIASLLGLAEDATEEQITEEIAKLKAAPGETSTVPPVITNLLDLPATASTAQVSAAIMERTYRPDADADKAAIAELKASKRVDYWAKDQRKFTPAERDWAMNYALKDPDGFELYAAKKAPVVPDPNPPAGAKGELAATTHERDTVEFGEGLTADDEPLTDLERKHLRAMKGYVNLKQYLKTRRAESREARLRAAQ